ncbi:MAG: transcriptional repressor [Paracoccaceae bacterium]
MSSPDVQPEPGLALEAHNHADCCGGVLARAEALAVSRGARLTPVRRRTLEILLRSHRAVGAYEVLEKLSESGFGNQPPVAYRALDFLVDQGLAHRIRRINAFAACMHPGHQHTPAFFICRNCGSVAEAPAEAVRNAMMSAASGIGFSIERMNVEALGLCPACEGADA